MSDSSGDELPIKFGPVSNGEFYPVPHTPLVAETIRRTNRLADTNARRLGISRRRFLSGASGAAATLFVLGACSKEKNAAEGGDAPGGTFDIPPDTTLDEDAAIESLDGDEFIFDVQSHFIDYDLSTTLPDGFVENNLFPQARCPEGAAVGDARTCFTVESYWREMFVRSDTAMAIVSALPAPPEGQEFTNYEGLIAAETARQLGCLDRVLVHGGAYPHVGGTDAALAGMTMARQDHEIAAWKIYTMVPANAAFFFDDHDPDLPQIGQTFIDHVREIGPPIICTHRGMKGIVGSTPELTSPADIGPAAAANPDINFVVYHSGYEPGTPEGPYDPTDPAPAGIDRLLRSLADAGVGPNENVYAELGGTWWFAMQDPDQAAHVLGKLLAHVGVDRVVWGTDSIWFGTPQDQIQALRTFQISEEFQERYGYPELTDEVKAKIFGLSSAELYGVEPEGACAVELDDLQQIRATLPPAPTYGPRTAAEAAAAIRAHQGHPFV